MNLERLNKIIATYIEKFDMLTNDDCDENMKWRAMYHFKENFDTSWNAKAEKRVTEVFDRYDNMLHSFGEMVAGEKENPWSYDYEFKLYKIILECCAENSRK